jgi:hypothetical protein
LTSADLPLSVVPKGQCLFVRAELKALVQILGATAKLMAGALSPVAVQQGPIEALWFSLLRTVSGYGKYREAYMTQP